MQVVRSEEERFDAVLTAGLPRLEEALDRAAGGLAASLPGDEAFRLYDSLGVPLDFMEDLAGQRGLSIDREGYERAMEGQRERARAGSSFETKKAQEFAFASDDGRAAALAPGDQFEGYTPHLGRPASRSWRCSTPSGKQTAELDGRPDRLRRARADAVLPRVRRPGVRQRRRSPNDATGASAQVDRPRRGWRRTGRARIA